MKIIKAITFFTLFAAFQSHAMQLSSHSQVSDAADANADQDLFQAARTGNSLRIEELFNNGAYVYQRNQQGQTALEVAAERGMENNIVCEQLLQKMLGIRNRKKVYNFLLCIQKAYPWQRSNFKHVFKPYLKKFMEDDAKAQGFTSAQIITFFLSLQHLDQQPRFPSYRDMRYIMRPYFAKDIGESRESLRARSLSIVLAMPNSLLKNYLMRKYFATEYKQQLMMDFGHWGIDENN